MTFPNYELDRINLSVLDKEIKALGIISAKFLGITFADGVCHIGFEGIPSVPDISAVDSLMAAYSPPTDLIVAKKDKYKAIDARTQELIDEGFEYPAASDQFFSLSLEEQVKLSLFNQVRNEAAVKYPIRWDFLDNSGAIDLSNNTEFLDFYLTALITYRTYMDGGTFLKDSVRVATTIAEVNAVIDKR